MGITHRRAVLIIYGFSVAFTVAALGISIGRSWQVGAAMLGASAVLIGLVRFVGYFELTLLRSRQKARLRSRDCEMLRYAIPRLPRLFGEARTEAELLERIGTFAAEAELDFVEVSLSAEEVAYRWARSPGSPRREGVTARFPIGRDDIARAVLHFGWTTDDGDVSPQSDILLQVATDILAKNLTRLHSRFAPQPSEAGASEAARTPVPMSAPPV